jgi:hypothetical protein
MKGAWLPDQIRPAGNSLQGRWRMDVQAFPENKTDPGINGGRGCRMRKKRHYDMFEADVSKDFF